MKALLPLLLPLLAWLCPALATAADEADAKKEKEPPSLAEVAAAKQDALLMLREELPNPEPGGPQHGRGLGVFISPDGLALLNLMNLATANKPEILTADGKTMLPLGSILGIFPEPELALVKLKHKPKTWVPLARKEPEVGESIAIAGLSDFNPTGRKVAPVLGPVLAKRSTLGGNLREPTFRKIMSLGAGMSVQQKQAFAQGSWAVNQQGELVAVKCGVQMAGNPATGTQMLIMLSPLAGIAEQVDAMVKSAKPIPFPLPAASNPIDLALLDAAYNYYDKAYQARDFETARKWTEELRKRYPDSKFVAGLTPTDMTDLAELPRLEASAPVASQVQRLRARADFLVTRKKDQEGAIAELKAALPLCPEDFPEIHLAISVLLAQLGHLDEMEPVLLKLHALEPDSISIAALLEARMTQKGKHEEAQKFTDRIFELENLYRAK